MSTPKPTAPVKAWAVVNKDGEIEFGTIVRSRGYAKKLAYAGETVIPVLITPLTSEEQEKK